LFGDGGPLRFIIGNPKYFEGHGGPGGPNPPLFRFDGYPTKKLFTSHGIFIAHSQVLFPLESRVWTTYQQQYGLMLLQMELQLL
jgi:hypothetical protein